MSASKTSSARAGAGIAVLPDFAVEDDGALVLARPDDPPLLREIWLVFHTDMEASAPVRVAIECLKDA